MTEMWKEIIGYGGRYKISNFGNIRGLRKNLLKCHKNNWGYYAISLLYKNKRKTYLVHRLVAIHFIENVENKPFINHIDGNKLNNNFNNLEWVTQKENIQHAVRIGLTLSKDRKKSKVMRNLKSEESPRAILKSKDILTIRKLYKSNKYTQLELSNKYGVCRSTIGKIVTFKNWNKL